jgi:small-conductance mechanosensitive channel
MERHERRAAFSAFIWTIAVMSIAGGLILWQSDAIHAIPSNQATADSSDITQYQNALDEANTRLTEASQRITTLEQQIAQANQAAQTAQADQVVPPTTTDSAPTGGIDATAAIEIAKQVAGRLKPIADPELVDLEGQTVWSIVYTPGTVYVNQADGQIVLVQRNNETRGSTGDDDDDGH